MQRLQPDVDDAAGTERALTGIPHTVFAPADGESVGVVEAVDPDQVPDLVTTARRALASWSRTAPHERATLLERAAVLVDSAANDLAVLHARESGKVIAQARKEVAGAASLLRANAGIGRFDAGYLAPTGALPGGERDLTIVERVPLGVVVCVIPFNFPVELTVEKAAAALAAGNVVILKPPPQNPLAAVRTAELIRRAGLPDGVLQVAPGARELSAALCAAPGVDAVSLTGSVGAGVAVATATAHLLRPLHLELGGNGASIVLADADLDLVIAETVRGRLLMNGQACAATKRLVVHHTVAGEVTERLESALGGVAMGDPVDPTSDLGPLIDAPSADRVASQVRRIVSEGGNLVLGSGDADGPWFAPTVVGAVPTSAAVAADDEIFGPVVPVIPVSSDDEAVETVNRSRLGLTAAVYTADIGRAMAIASRLEVGGVVVNGTNNYRPPVVPFGGVGLAGTGREGIGYTYEEMTRTRFIAIRGVRPPAVAVSGS